MIESEHKLGSNEWYDDLEAELRRRGMPILDGTVEDERVRLMFSERISIPPDNRRLEKFARESGELPDHLTYDQWIESMMPAMREKYHDLFPPGKGV